jgi:hypothetical protein
MDRPRASAMSTTGEIWLEFFEPLSIKGHWDEGARERVWHSLAMRVEMYGSLRARTWAKETVLCLSPIWNPPQ